MVANPCERAFDRASPLNRDAAPGAGFTTPGDLSRLGDLLPQILARYGCATREDDSPADRRGAETVRFRRGPSRDPLHNPETNRPDLARGRRRVG